MSCEIGLARHQDTKLASKAWPKMPKNANLVVFWAKNLNFYWKKQKFVLVPTLQKNHLRILFALFFGQAWDKIGQKYKYLSQNDQKCQFWAKFGRFRPKILILTGGSKSFCTHITEKPPGQLVHISFLRGIKSNGPKKPIFGQIWPFLS